VGPSGYCPSSAFPCHTEQPTGLLPVSLPPFSVAELSRDARSQVRLRTARQPLAAPWPRWAVWRRGPVTTSSTAASPAPVPQHTRLLRGGDGARCPYGLPPQPHARTAPPAAPHAGRRPAARGLTQGQPCTPPSAMATAASAIRSGSSAAPSSMRRTAASTTPWSSIAVSRGCS
jgi:hypothetical protein